MVKRVIIIPCPDCKKNMRVERTFYKGELMGIKEDCPYCNRHKDYY